MDLDTLLHRHQLSMKAANRSLAPREKRAREHFAREFAEQIRRTREAVGASRAVPGSVT